MLLYTALALSIAWLILHLFGNDFKQKTLFKLKWMIAYVYIWILKRKREPTFDFSHRYRDVRRAGIRPTPETHTKEFPRALDDDINAEDTVGIWGIDNHGNALITRLSRRHDRRADVEVYMKLASGEEYQLPIQPDTQVYNTDGKSFSAAGLTYEVLEPLRTWRVAFNGILRKDIRPKRSDNDDESDDDNCVCVKFNFIWHPMYIYMAMPDDVNLSNLATAIAKMKWTKDFILSNSIALPKEWYEQCGELHGTVRIEHNDAFELLLRGQKDRRNGQQDFTTMQQGISIKGVLKNGLAFHLYGNVMQDGLKDYVQGYVTPASNYLVRSLSKCSLDIAAVVKNVENPQDIVIHFVAGGCEYLLLSKESNVAYSAYYGDNWEYEATTKLVSFKLNGNEGFGLVEYMLPHNGNRPLPRQKSLPLLSEPNIIKTSKLIVSFNERECQSSKVVGGKGSSLALLTALSEGGIENFIVPAGLCVTNEAFKNHLIQNPNLENTIKILEDVAWKRMGRSMKQECSNVMETMVGTQISSELRNALKQQLMSQFGNEFGEMRFAIRSSAIGEDSEELSAAGQNETYLGVKGIEEIETAIVKCWASQFSFRSVEYKRQYGQLLNGGMGVVVQTMVPSDVAGVLFTRDPQSGSPAYLTITSNYGLGESVVSATADPDTVILKRTWDDKLMVHRKDIGKKNLKITMSENGGVSASDINSEESSRCTLSDEMALKLGKIAINLENRFGSARDNEWALHENQIFLLQSRPVTSDAALTDFEVQHEFSTTFNTDDERYTTANVQEVMPGAFTPLTLTGSTRAMGVGFLKKMHKHLIFRYDPTILELSVFYNHCIFNRIQQKAWSLEEKKSLMTKAMEVGFFGRVIDDDDTVKIAMERYENPPLVLRLFLMSMSIPGMLFGPWIMRKAERTLRTYKLPISHTRTPEEAYKTIEDHMLNIEHFVTTHMNVSMASTVWNLMLLNILSKGVGDFNMDIYSDFATLIGSSNGAESGGVPFGLQELAHAISLEIEAAAFSSMTQQVALKWLQEGNGRAAQKFKDFLERHGHRGYKEFEMETITWGMDPLKLLLVLQNMLKNPMPVKKTTNSTSIETTISQMKTSIVGFKRKLLTLSVYVCRTYICYREQAKSMMIHFLNCLRVSYRHLAKLMVESGLLPDPQLLYFLTHDEINQLIQTRSPRIIMRAKRRQRQHSYMDSIVFPEMITGYPIPVNDDAAADATVFEGATQAKGYPACSGVIQGTARVIKTFEEVDSIQPGDILITHATDIAWSPYFPILSGVVTEIGGLISHGAVVAREYGLPCLIATENATKIFKSGDTVKLDATNGILIKVE